MEEFLRTALSSLPTVATHPLAFVAYLVVVLAWLIIAWRVNRNKNLLEHLEKFPPNARLQALQSEIGHVPLKEGLSPEQYLKSKIHLYYFLGFTVLCLTVVVIFVVSAVTSNKHEGTANVDVSLYNVQSMDDIKPIDPELRFERDLKGQDDIVQVKHQEVQDSDKRRYRDNILKYAYSRVNEKIYVKPELPYLSLTSKPGPIPNYPGCLFTFPTLSIKVVNNTNQTLVLTESSIKVKTSKIQKLPILSVTSSLLAPGKLLLENEGWTDLINPTVKFGVTDKDSCNNVPLTDAKNTVQIPTFQSGASIDLSKQIPSDLKKADYICAFGEVTYNTESNEVRTVAFRTTVLLLQVFPSLMFPTYTYSLFLEADKEDYTKYLPISHEVKSGDSDLFLIQIATNKWSQFDLVFSFRTAESNYLPGNEVMLEIFVPRSITDHIASKGRLF